MLDDRTIEQAVETAWVSTFDQQSWDENRPFDQVGKDSLEVLSMLMDLGQALGVEIPDDIVSPEMTPRVLIGAVSRLVSAPAPGVAHDDRPLVFLFAGGMSATAIHALQDGLAQWFRLVSINARGAGQEAAEQMRRCGPAGAINVIADADAAAVAMDAAARLARTGYRPGFTFVLDRDAHDNVEQTRARIIDAFAASQRASI